MPKPLEGLRAWLRRFLGINELATLPEAAVMARVGDALLRQHRVFGDPARVTLGRDVVLNDALINTSSGRVTLGDYAFCGHGVSLLTGRHEYTETGHARQVGIPQEGFDIHVGTGVWIASNATVLGPCTIGEHAVIAAGAIVSGEVEAGWVYGGVPARPVRRIALKAAP